MSSARVVSAAEWRVARERLLVMEKEATRAQDALAAQRHRLPGGVEALGSIWTFLDLTPLGRQEAWKDSPAGSPQTRPYTWWRRHDDYGHADGDRMTTDTSEKELR